MVVRMQVMSDEATLIEKVKALFPRDQKEMANALIQAEEEFSAAAFQARAQSRQRVTAVLDDDVKSSSDEEDSGSVLEGPSSEDLSTGNMYAEMKAIAAMATESGTTKAQAEQIQSIMSSLNSQLEATAEPPVSPRRTRAPPAGTGIQAIRALSPGRTRPGDDSRQDEINELESGMANLTSMMSQLLAVQANQAAPSAAPVAAPSAAPVAAPVAAPPAFPAPKGSALFSFSASTNPFAMDSPVSTNKSALFSSPNPFAKSPPPESPNPFSQSPPVTSAQAPPSHSLLSPELQASPMKKTLPFLTMIPVDSPIAFHPLEVSKVVDGPQPVAANSVDPLTRSMSRSVSPQHTRPASPERLARGEALVKGFHPANAPEDMHLLLWWSSVSESIKLMWRLSTEPHSQNSRSSSASHSELNHSCHASVSDMRDLS